MGETTLAPPTSSSSRDTSSRLHLRRNPPSASSDAFYKLPADYSLKATSNSESQDAEQDQSFFTKIVFSPLIAASFLLSLFYVEYKSRVERAAQQSVQYHGWNPWTRFVLWLNPEPYQTAREMEQKQQATAVGRDGQRNDLWAIRKKHRKVAMMYFSDAWALHTSVMAMLVSALLGILILGALAYPLYRYWK